MAGKEKLSGAQPQWRSQEMGTETPPLFSVLIPTYNRASLLLRAIDSVLAQTYPHYEIITIDDGSTDDTVMKLQRHLQEVGGCEHVRYVWQEQQGKSAALNRGLALARGDWIAFLDSDDFWHPEKLASQVCAIRRFSGECGACFTDARYINNPHLTRTAFQLAGKSYDDVIGSIRDPVHFVLRAPHGVYMQTIAIRADAMRRVGEFDKTLRVTQDTDFIYRAALQTRLCYVNRPLVEIDRTPISRNGLMEILSKDDLLRLQERQHMYEKWWKLSEVCGRHVQKEIEGYLQRVHSERANVYMLNEEYNEARHWIATALKVKCTPRVAVKWMLARFMPELLCRILKRNKNMVKREVGLP